MSPKTRIFFFNIESSTYYLYLHRQRFCYFLTFNGWTQRIPPDLFPHRSLVCTMYIYLMIVSCDSRTNNTCKTSSLAENGISELFFKSLTYPEYIVGQNLTKKVQFRREALCTGCLKAPHGILGEKKFFPSHYSLVFQEKTNAFLAVGSWWLNHKKRSRKICFLLLKYQAMGRIVVQPAQPDKQPEIEHSANLCIIRQSAQYCATFSTAGSDFFAHFLAKF